MGNTTQDEGQSSKTGTTIKGGASKSSGTGTTPKSGTGAAQGSIYDWTPQEVSAAASASSPPSGFASSAFDITEVIPKKFSGENGDFPEFYLRLQMADSAMAKMGYNNAQRFLLLLTVLEGHPYFYVKDLPLSSETSYQRAICTLKELYSGKQSVFRDAVIRALNLPKCTKDFESRSALHSEMTSFFHIAHGQNMTAEEAFQGSWMTIFEAKMDDQILREWYNTTTKYQKPEGIGHSLNEEDLLAVMHRVMLQDLHAKQSGSTTSTLPPPPRGRVRVPWAPGDT